jgi:DNA-binding transcriptional LysR family regulator
MRVSDWKERSISLRRLKLFESVVRLGSSRRASEECHLSQPAVTQAIAKLERQVGKPLLSRRASGSFLNDCGRLFHRRTTRLFEKIEQASLDLGLPPSCVSQLLVAGRITRVQLASLIAIAENTSFAQAARSLGISRRRCTARRGS